MSDVQASAGISDVEASAGAEKSGDMVDALSDAMKTLVSAPMPDVVPRADLAVAPSDFGSDMDWFYYIGEFQFYFGAVGVIAVVLYYVYKAFNKDEPKKEEKQEGSQLTFSDEEEDFVDEVSINITKEDRLAQRRLQAREGIGKVVTSRKTKVTRIKSRKGQQGASEALRQQTKTKRRPAKRKNASVLSEVDDDLADIRIE
jgi:hypothetical protein